MGRALMLEYQKSVSTHTEQPKTAACVFLDPA
jgi:hypothetical protein